MDHARRKARLAFVELPDFGSAAIEPLLPPSLFVQRTDRLRAAMDARGYDHLVVWGDREHSANIAYFGLDPRSRRRYRVGVADEPAIIVATSARPGALPRPRSPVHFRTCGLTGQPRRSRSWCRSSATRHRTWKPRRCRRRKTYASPVIEVPAFLVTRYGGSPVRRRVENAPDVIIDPSNGMRGHGSSSSRPFEWAACRLRAVRRVLAELHGMTRECARARLERGAAVVSAEDDRRPVEGALLVC